MSKALKRMLATQLGDQIAEANGLMLIDCGSMTVEKSEAFRRDLREKAGGARLRIIHNQTAKIAIRARWTEEDAEAPFDDGALDGMMNGPSAIVFGGDGPISIAKVVRDWKKKHKALELKGAIADGELFVGDEAAALADMPDLPQLRAMMLGAIMGSARGIAVSLSAVYCGLARCMQARIDQSEEGGEEAA